MAKSAVDFFCIVKVFFLFCLFFSASVQTDGSWGKLSLHHLVQLLKSYPERLLPARELGK